MHANAECRFPNFDMSTCSVNNSEMRISIEWLLYQGIRQETLGTALFVCRVRNRGTLCKTQKLATLAQPFHVSLHNSND